MLENTMVQLDVLEFYLLPLEYLGRTNGYISLCALVVSIPKSALDEIMVLFLFTLSPKPYKSSNNQHWFMV